MLLVVVVLPAGFHFFFMCACTKIKNGNAILL